MFWLVIQSNAAIIIRMTESLKVLLFVIVLFFVFLFDFINYFV